MFLFSLLKAEVGKLQSMGQLTVFVNKVLLGYNYAHLFLYCLCPCICSCATRAEWSTHVDSIWLTSQKYLLHCPLRKIC